MKLLIIENSAPKPLRSGYRMRFTPQREPFNQDKAIEAAIYLVNLRGGRIHHLKLVKLMYLADRMALLQLGRTISDDRHVSMEYGPVGSTFLSLISSLPVGPSSEDSSVFARSFFRPTKLEIELQRNFDSTQRKLSNRERDILSKVFDEFGHKERWDIVKHTHTLPEWANPNDQEVGSIPISLKEILRAEGRSDEELQDFEDFEKERNYLESLC